MPTTTMLDTDDIDHQAKRLRELFRGRLPSHHVAVKLIEDFGGEAQAVDFVMNEKADVVQSYLKKTPDYLAKLREDSAKIANLLQNVVEYEVRQFACGSCVRSWWKKVPVRKMVSKCRRCHLKYDPIPRDKEWGYGKFHCKCGNSFVGYAIMGKTTSECYQCGAEIPVGELLPPWKGRKRRSQKPHSCNGTNCFAHAHQKGSGAVPASSGSKGKVSGGSQGNISDGTQGNASGAIHADTLANAMQDIRDSYEFGRKVASGEIDLAGNNGSPAPGAYVSPEPAMCIHPKSNKPGYVRLHCVSERHRSTGSTVSTFLTQGSLDTGTVSVARSLGRIDE